MNNNILRFISGIRTKDTIKVFTEGYCYWFAIILSNYAKYRNLDNEIVYNPILNHFAVRINNDIYDITGKINDSDFTVWDEYKKQDKLETERIIKYCILKDE